MKRTQLVELFATIRATIVSFFSILMFVALGVGVFLGINWSGPALRMAGETLFEEGSLYDVQVQFVYGLTAADLDRLAGLDGVSEVEGAYVSDQIVDCNGKVSVVKVQSMTTAIDTLVVRAGELPSQPGEIAVLESWADDQGLSVGDTIIFDHDNDDGTGMARLVHDSFTLTALVDAPEYFSVDKGTFGFTALRTGSVDGIAWVLEEDFDQETFDNAYPVVLIRSDELRDLDSFGDEYQAKERELVDRVSVLGGELAGARCDEIRASAQSELDKAIKDRDDAKVQVEDGQRQIDESREQMLALGMPEAAVDEALADAEKELEDAKALLAEADEKISEGQDKVDAIEDYAWTVMGRESNASVATAKSLSDILPRLALSMAGLFVVVGLLVAYSAVSRLVHEQIIQIGTKKALGLRRREITRSYLAYSGVAVLVGAAAGIALGILVVERIVGKAVAGYFCLGAYSPAIIPVQAVAAIVVELVLVLFATWFACHDVLRENAVSLLGGEKPPEGKTRFFETWKIWERLPLLSQTVVNNCLNERRRVIATLIGIAGVTALVVTALTLNDDVLDSFARQYEEVYGFDTLVYVDDSLDGSADELARSLEDAGTKAVAGIKGVLSVRIGEETTAVPLYVATGEGGFGDMFRLKPAKHGKVVSDNTPSDVVAPSSGVKGLWLSSAFSAHRDIEAGDTVEITDAHGFSREVVVAGIFEYYLGHGAAVMDAGLYDELMGSATPNVVYLARGESQLEEIEELASSVGGSVSLRDDKSEEEKNFDTFSNVSAAVVGIYLALAVLMAFVVLLNLNVMHVNEKKRELIVLMICGYSAKQAKGYLRGDAVALTVLGIVFGLVLGIVVGYFSVLSMEPQDATFIKDIDWVACAVATLVTIVLSAIVTALALRRVPRFRLTDINKV